MKQEKLCERENPNYKGHCSVCGAASDGHRTAASTHMHTRKQTNSSSKPQAWTTHGHTDRLSFKMTKTHTYVRTVHIVLYLPIYTQDIHDGRCFRSLCLI